MRLSTRLSTRWGRTECPGTGRPTIRSLGLVVPLDLTRGDRCAHCEKRVTVEIGQVFGEPMEVAAPHKTRYLK